MGFLCIQKLDTVLTNKHVSAFHWEKEDASVAVRDLYRSLIYDYSELMSSKFE